MDVYEVRKRRLAEYIKEKYRGNRSAFCRATGEDNSYIARLYSDKPGQSKPFSETVARRIERAAGLGKDWLDRDERASDGQNLPVHVGNEISTTPNTTGGVNLSPDLIQVIEWYQGMGPRNQQRAQAQLKYSGRRADRETVVRAQMPPRAYVLVDQHLRIPSPHPLRRVFFRPSQNILPWGIALFLPLGIMLFQQHQRRRLNNVDHIATRPMARKPGTFF